MKIPPMESEIFNADAQTDSQRDMPNLLVDFRNFVEFTKVPFPVMDL